MKSPKTGMRTTHACWLETSKSDSENFVFVMALEAVYREIKRTMDQQSDYCNQRQTAGRIKAT